MVIQSAISFHRVPHLASSLPAWTHEAMLWVNICSAVGELSFFFATVLFQTHYISLSHDHWSIESIWCYHYPCSACPAQTVLCSAASCLGITGSPVAPKSPSLRRRPALASPRNGRARLLLRQVKICSSEIRDLQSAAGLTTVPQTQILPFRSRFSQSWHHLISFFLYRCRSSNALSLFVLSAQTFNNCT